MRNISLSIIGLLAALSPQAQKHKPAEDTDSLLYTQTKYRLIGPFRGGRADAVAGAVHNKTTFYFGSSGGGLWKTVDGGSNWKNVSDGSFGGGIGAVSVAPSDESIVYAAEGEGTIRNNVTEGMGGLWRSDDAGRHWKNVGLPDSRHIVRILVHPKNPDIVWVAVLGHLFGPAKNRGVYKTTDGGKTWKQVLYVNDQAGCSELAMEPGNPSVLYAGMWRVIRTPYSLESGGDGSGLYKSTDGGETWKDISKSKGLPRGVWGAVNVTVAPSNPDKVYAMIENKEGGLYVSKDAAKTWTKVSGDNNIKQRAWYFNRVFVDPRNEDVVYCTNVEFMKSTDGGKTFEAMRTPHSDHHELWIDPEDPNRMALADDGGGHITFDGGRNWSSSDNQPTAQIYRVSTDNAFPYRLLGAQQDNTTIRIRSRTNGIGITDKDWSPTAGFESGFVVADPRDPDIVYGGNYDGFIGRLNHRTDENRVITVWPDNPTGSGADSMKYRFQWNFPLFFSPNTPGRLYAAGNQLFATDDEGLTWTAISPDLTTDDKTKQGSSGGPITKDNTSAEYYCTIFAAAESPYEKGLLWTGSDDGLVYVSKDAGGHWDNVTPPDAGKWTMWNCIEPDPFHKGGAYIVGTRFKLDDYTPYVYKTEDYGKTWTRITTGFAPTHFARCLRADPVRQGLLYAGTEFGMYISFDDGAHWKPFQLNLPVTPITDLAIKDNSLLIATEGRAFWSLDNLGFVRDRPAGLDEKRFYVFPVGDAWRMGGFRGRFQPVNVGENPPNGVVFQYWLGADPDSANVSVTIFDKQHKPIRTFGTKASETEDKLVADKGMNRFVWDMNYPQGKRIPGMLLWNGFAGGPKAAPGTYSARLRYDKDSIDVPFVIKGDPNYNLTEAQYDEQVNFLLAVRDKFDDVQKAILRLRKVRTQLGDLNSRLDTAKDKDIRKLSDSLGHRLTQVEEALYQTKSKSSEDMLNFPIKLNDKLAGLYGAAAAGNTPPSKQARDVFADLSARVDVQLNKLKDILGPGLDRLNRMIYEKQVPVIGAKDE